MKKTALLFFNNRYLGEMKDDEDGIMSCALGLYSFRAGDVFELEDMQRVNVEPDDSILAAVIEDDGDFHEWHGLNMEVFH